MPDALDDYLSRHEAAFTAACAAILRGPVPAGTAYGLFWFQIDDTEWDPLPIALAWCDRDHVCEVQYPSPLTSLSCGGGSPPEGLDDDAVGERVFHWIFRCWNQAGGKTSPLPFYGHNYHTSEQFCLRRARYVTEEEIATDIASAV